MRIHYVYRMWTRAAQMRVLSRGKRNRVGFNGQNNHFLSLMVVGGLLEQFPCVLPLLVGLFVG